MTRVAAVVVAALAGLGAALCFMHFPSVTVEGHEQRCRGVTLFGEMSSEVEADEVTWRPRGCEEEYHRWLAYAGGLAVVALVTGTGAVFYRREDEPSA